MKVNKRHTRKGFTLVELLVVIAIIAALAAMAMPVVMKQRKKADAQTAVSNGRQIHMLLMEFGDDYGEFPSDETATGDLSGYSGSYSNDYLAQLLEGGYVDSEEIFYAKGGASTDKKPDNVMGNKSDQLTAGECGFAYLKGQSSSDRSGRPVLMAPMSDNGQEFKPDPYGNKAVVIRLDGSTKQFPINKKTKKAKIPGGKTLFQTGSDTVWEEDGFTSSDLVKPK